MSDHSKEISEYRRRWNAMLIDLRNSKGLPPVAYTGSTECAIGGTGIIYGAGSKKQTGDFLLSVW